MGVSVWIENNKQEEKSRPLANGSEEEEQEEPEQQHRLAWLSLSTNQRNTIYGSTSVLVVRLWLLFGRVCDAQISIILPRLSSVEVAWSGRGPAEWESGRGRARAQARGTQICQDKKFTSMFGNWLLIAEIFT